jgi:hypothetical protein
MQRAEDMQAVRLALRVTCMCVLRLCWLSHSASPLELAACEEEEKIVCNQGHIKGQQGVALDDMVYIMTRMARQMEEVGHMHPAHGSHVPSTWVSWVTWVTWVTCVTWATCGNCG